MRILFQHQLDERRLSEYKYNYALYADAAFLHNHIGLAKFYVFDEYDNFILDFESTILDVVLNITSNYASIIDGTVSKGCLFYKNTEWDIIFSFIYENENIKISFSNNKQLIMSSNKFYESIFELSVLSLDFLEYFYNGLNENDQYIKMRQRIFQDLKPIA
jgi:hypothetical protein